MIFRKPHPRPAPAHGGVPQMFSEILRRLRIVQLALDVIEDKLDKIELPPPPPASKPRINFNIGPVSNRKP